MQDAKYINRCSHHVVGEELDITKVPGKEGIYTATLSYPAVTTNALVFIRNYNDEKSFMYGSTSYLDTLSYSYETLTGSIDELPKSSIITKIGITNFRFVDDRTILFGENPDDLTIKRLQIIDGAVPKPLFLVDYYAKSLTCPICGGSGNVQDISFSGTGAILTSVGHQKLVQTVLKSLVTVNGESAEDINYGSALDSVIGMEIDITSSATIQKCIYDSLNYVMQLQAGQELEPEETLTGIASISIEESKTDPSKINITVVVRDGLAQEVPCVIEMGVK